MTIVDELLDNYGHAVPVHPEDRETLWMAISWLVDSGFSVRYSSGGRDLAAIHLKEGKMPLICQWTNLYAQMDDGDAPESCNAEALYTTCDPRDGVVCAKHKCRCSKPLEPNICGMSKDDYDAYLKEFKVRVKPFRTQVSTNTLNKKID